MKLTKKATARLDRILAHLNRARAVIDDAGTVVARRTTEATTTLHFKNAAGESCVEINKEYGSDLCGLQDAHRLLLNILETGKI